MGKHLEASLQRDIDLIRGKILEMAGCCESALRDVLTAFVEGNRQLAYLVILSDQHIDDLERQIDRLCLEFIVRQQPVAKHLRLAYTAIKINAELERIGDYAESIARQTLKLRPTELNLSFEPFQQEADLAIRMLHDAITAFVEEDAELARRTMQVEDEIDSLRKRIDADLVRMSQEGRIPVEALTPLLTISRRFERTSDQAKNICSQVLYMCTGEYLRHQGAEVFRILFVDRHHAGVSRLAEAIGNALPYERIHFTSAGLDPRMPDPRLVAFLNEKGLEPPSGPARSVDQVPNLEHQQVIVALHKEARRVFPTRPTKTATFLWELDDPTELPGSLEENREAFERAYEFLQTHIKDLSAAIMGENQSQK